ncbi:MAG: hypothetical protein KIT43_10880 [Bauldia sp.]|nr:hypothetical protein [Bauldia sp.]MCW5717654.1 hypothetical protein [Bauldia sp.]
MSIARTDDRASARDSRTIGGISIAVAATVAAVGAALGRLRRREARRTSELPISGYLRRDLGLQDEPLHRGWREG